MAEPRESGISFGGVLFSDLYFKLNIQFLKLGLRKIPHLILTNSAIITTFYKNNWLRVIGVGPPPEALAHN